MLTGEDNQLLTRIGPGTPMGDVMRQYWQPAVLSSELPERDGPPLRVRLLGEDLIAFRDTNGRVGLLGAKSYRVVEKNGIVWTYMGPEAQPPALPELGWTDVPVENKLMTKQLLECNYAQALEGDLDPSHVSF